MANARPYLSLKAQAVFQVLYGNDWENRLLRGFLYADQFVERVELPLTTRRRGYFLVSNHICAYNMGV